MADNIPNFKCAIPSTALNNALFGGQSAYTLLGPDGIPQTALANLGAGVRPNLLDNPWQLLPQPDMDYGTQLEKCQRFLHKIPIGSYHGRASSSSAVRFTIPIYPPMRANPVLQGNASWMCNRYDGHQIAISSIAPSSVYDSEAGFVSLLAVVDGADSLADYTLTLLSASEPVYLSAQL